jgi:GNAT superfamily N-acetyltransferase
MGKTGSNGASRLISLTPKAKIPRMTVIGQAHLSESEEIKKLIAEYHRSEGLAPNKERIAWAVRLQLRDTPGLLLVAREKDAIVGVALAVYTPSAELGRVMTVNDFFVRPEHRRKGVGRKLVKRLVEECKRMKIDEIGLEVLHRNKTAAAFWNLVGFRPADRFLSERNWDRYGR